MLRWTLVFLIMAALMAVIGFGSLEQPFAEVARILFFAFFGACTATYFMSLTVLRDVDLDR